ncbi:MAG TPA: DUF1697 domain-containing protein [Coriobacteriia bacterium]
MPRYAAFLRGMNLGGRRITNTDLCAHVAAMGFDEVGSFRASGNLVVTTPKAEQVAAVARRIEEGLAEALGYSVPTFVRTDEQMHTMAGHVPFSAKELDASTGKVQVILLQKEPTAAAAQQSLAHQTDQDRLHIHDQQLYWLPSGGMSDSDLDLKALEKALGPTTIRTKGTIDQITTKFFSI